MKLDRPVPVALHVSIVVLVFCNQFSRVLMTLLGYRRSIDAPRRRHYNYHPVTM